MPSVLFHWRLRWIRYVTTAYVLWCDVIYKFLKADLTWSGNRSFKCDIIVDWICLKFSISYTGRVALCNCACICSSALSTRAGKRSNSTALNLQIFVVTCLLYGLLWWVCWKKVWIFSIYFHTVSRGSDSVILYVYSSILLYFF